MVLPDEVDPEREILKGIKRISKCKVRKLQETETYLVDGAWEEKNQGSKPK